MLLVLSRHGVVAVVDSSNGVLPGLSGSRLLGLLVGPALRMFAHFLLLFVAVTDDRVGAVALDPGLRGLLLLLLLALALLLVRLLGGSALAPGGVAAVTAATLASSG